MLKQSSFFAYFSLNYGHFLRFYPICSILCHLIFHL